MAKGLGVAEGHLGSWKRPCGHFWHPVASPHPEYSITITCSWLSSTKPILGVKHRALQAEARAQLAPVGPAVPKALHAQGLPGLTHFLPETSMPSESLWLCDPGKLRRGLSTGLWLRADVPCAVTEQHFHCHPCFIVVPFPEHPRLRGARFGSVFSFFSTSEAVWGLHLKVLVHPAEGDNEGRPRHESHTSRQSPKATFREHHPFPAAQSCLKGPQLHLSPGEPWVQDPCSELTTEQAPGADTHPEQIGMSVLSKHSYCCCWGGMFASPAQEKEQHWEEWHVPPATPTPGRHQGGAQHPPHITAPSLPLLPQKEPVMPH